MPFNFFNPGLLILPPPSYSSSSSSSYLGSSKVNLIMALPWRSCKTSFRKAEPMKRSTDADISIPAHFRCPISLDLMRDPVIAPTGITYDRQSIESWLEAGSSACPVTKQEMSNQDLIPNHSIRKMIQDWCDAHRAFGIERIPTPKIPVTAAQVEDITSEIASATSGRDAARCQQLAAKVKRLARESERNRRLFASSIATTRILAAAFATFAGDSDAEELSEEILAALALLSPLDDEAAAHIGSPESLRRLVSVMEQGGTFAARLNAALATKELLASSRGKPDAIAGSEGLVEALARLVKEPISPQATKAALMAIFQMVSGEGRARAARVVELGLMPVAIEILVDRDKGMCERALAVVDGLLSCQGGREAAAGHVLAVPVLVKKMFRVSDMATEFVVSALWKLCKADDNGRDGGGEEEEEERRRRCLREALQVGAFQKLLLLLQIGCSEASKEKATILLKLLNEYKGSDECVDTMDFKGVKFRL